MHHRHRWTTLLATTALLAACGGDSAGPDDPTYPAVGGIWEFHATFDGLSASQAFVTGSIALTQPSREQPTLGGTWQLTATVGGDIFAGQGTVSQGSVTSTGQLTLTLIEPGAIETWTMTGTVVGTSAQGRFTLSDGFDALSGNWTGTRVTAGNAPALTAGDGTPRSPIIPAIRQLR